MKDPKRLFEDDSNPVSALLLRGGREDAPDRRRIERIVAGLVSAGGALASGKAGATALTMWGMAQWFAAGAIGGVVATSALFAVERPKEPALAVGPAVSTATDEPSARAAPRATGTSTPVSSAPVAPVDPPQRRPPSRVVRATTEVVEAPPSAPAGAPQSSLMAEAATLAEAKAALDRRAPAQALATLRSYRVRFPLGELAQDASYLEMEAELASGNDAAARGIAATLASGSAPSADRAREVLKGGKP